MDATSNSNQVIRHNDPNAVSISKRNTILGEYWCSGNFDLENWEFLHPEDRKAYEAAVTEHGDKIAELVHGFRRCVSCKGDPQ